MNCRGDAEARKNVSSTEIKETWKPPQESRKFNLRKWKNRHKSETKADRRLAEDDNYPLLSEVRAPWSPQVAFCVFRIHYATKTTANANFFYCVALFNISNVTLQHCPRRFFFLFATAAADAGSVKCTYQNETKIHIQRAVLIESDKNRSESSFNETFFPLFSIQLQFFGTTGNFTWLRILSVSISFRIESPFRRLQFKALRVPGKNSLRHGKIPLVAERSYATFFTSLTHFRAFEM